MIRLACVGDSITEGNELSDPGTESYPARLGVLLGTGWTVVNFGRRRSTAQTRGNDPYVQRLEFTRLLAFQPDRIVCMLGTNDAKPVNWVNGVDFEEDYAALVGRMQPAGGPKPRIHLALPPPGFPPGNFTIDPQILATEIVPRTRALARRLNLPVIDLHTPFLLRPDLLLDLVHPSAEGAAFMAEIVARSLRADLAKSNSTEGSCKKT